MNKKVLVTGAAGFIGSHVAEHCLRLGLEVVAVDDLSGGCLENVPCGAVFKQGDMRDVGFVRSLWNEGPYDHVYHLAAYAAEGLSHFIRRYNYETNLLASINLLNEAVNAGVQCFIFTSSIAVYGRGQVPMTEDMVPQPEDPYGISKYAFELDLKSAHEMFGLNYVVFRPHNVYGERQNIADRYRNVVGIFMNQILQGQPMSVFGDGRQTRAFSHVQDVAPVIAESALVPGAWNQVFNIGADQPHTVLELAMEVAKAFGVTPQLKHLPPRNEVVHAFSNHDKLRSFFDLNKTMSLPEGLQRMADWVKAHGPARPITFDHIEVEKNLPPSWRAGD